MDNPTESPIWQDLKSSYETDASVTSLLLVKCTGGSNAEVEYCVRADGGGWTTVRSGDANIGKNGYGKTREGDAKTPVGDYSGVSAFGIKPDPGTSMPYIDVRETTFACDEDCEWYNRIIDTAATGHDCKGEDMSAIAPAYNYGFTLDHNPENLYPLGSAIFFHCKGLKPYTGGCIAVDEDFMEQILKTCGSSPKVCIHLK